MNQACNIELAVIPEARIIAEDETHATICVRVEKAWLSRNIHFLAALADCAAVLTVLPMA
jgi:hypothetical protein